MENRNTQLAEAAYKLCQDVYKEKDYDTARIYIINAITHATELRFLKALVTLAKKTQYEQRRDVIEQFLNICSMALFQVPAEEVNDVQEIIFELQTVYDDTFACSSDKCSAVQTNQTWGVLLEKYSWNSMRRRDELTSLERLQEKSNFIQDILNSSVLTDSQKKQAEHEFQVCISYLDFLTKEFALKDVFSELENEFQSTGNEFYIAAKLQNATSILAQMWLSEISDVIPEEKFRADLSGYAKKIGEYEVKYNQLRSKSLYLSLQAKLSQASKKIQSNSGTFTHRLKACQEIIQEVSGALYELTDSTYVKDIQGELRNLTGEAEKLSKKRYAAYQSFCADKCRSAIKSYDDTNGRVTESDALKYLERWDIAKIDEALLTPEAAAIFHEAKGILIDKLSRINKADYQVKCVTSEKFSLEGF